MGRDNCPPIDRVCPKLREVPLAIYYRIVDQIIIVSGKTYPYKEQIKSLGGRFQSPSKIWQIQNNHENLERIDELCKAVGGGALQPAQISNTAIAQQNQNNSSRPQEKLIPETLEKPSVDGDIALTIGELMQSVHLKIQEAFPRSLWVVGEIQNFSNGKRALFFQLADFKEGGSKSATTSASCVMWQSTLESLKAKLNAKRQSDNTSEDELSHLLADGIRIRALVSVNFYKDRGSISLIIQDIDPRYTKGALALAREELLKEMRQKGLERKNASNHLRPFPFRVGLISAEGSRAKSDFLDQLLLYKFPGNVLFFPAHTQGEQSIQDICQGIKELSRANCDLIVITRGGGSLADLRWFDSREIALAIAHAKTPILSAIGHHDDVCVAEYMSYRREKTPTAAADYILSIFQSSKEKLDNASQILLKKLSASVEQIHRRQHHCLQRLQSFSTQFLFNEKEKITRSSMQITSAFQRRSQNFEKHFESFNYKLTSLSYSALHKHQMTNTEILSYLDRSVHNVLTEHRRKMDKLPAQLKEHSDRLQNQKAQELLRIETLVIKADPTPWLAKGWTQLMNDKSERISSINQVDVGQLLRAQLKDGQIELRVIRKI